MLDLKAVVSTAKAMYVEETADDRKPWDDLEDWMKLSWFLEAADRLGMRL